MYRSIVVGIALLVLASGGYFAWHGPQKATPPNQLDTLSKELQATGPEERIKAIARVAKLDAKAAVPQLIGVLAMPDEELRLHAAMALGEIGEPAVPALLKTLADPDKTVRFYAVWALGLAGPTAKSATPAVIKLLSDKDKDVQYKAAFALGRIGVDSDEAAAALMGAVNDPDPTVQEVATSSLVTLGARAVGPLRKALAARKCARVAAEILSRMAYSQNEDVVRAAIVAVPDILRAFDGELVIEDREIILRNLIAPFGTKALPALRDSVGEKNPRTRLGVAVVLGNIGAEAELHGDAAGALAAVELLSKMVTDDDPRVREAACGQLGQIQIGAEYGAAALQKALLDDTFAVSECARSTIIGHGGAWPLPADGKWHELHQRQHKLIQRIDAAKGDDKLRMACVMQWRYHELLQQNLMHPDPALRLRIAYALAKESWSLRHAAADVAAKNRVAVLTRQLVPVLAEAIKSKKATWRRDAAYGLSFLAPDARELVIPVLEAALKDEDDEVRAKVKLGIHQYKVFGGK